MKKFAAQRNDQVLASSYLHNLTTVDGTACFLGLKPRTDLTVDFRTATMKRIPIPDPLPSNLREALHQRNDYVAISEQIESLGYLIEGSTDESSRNHYKALRIAAYTARAKLEKAEQKNHQRKNKQRGRRDQTDWREAHFDRIRHMMPERDRLARTLFLKVPLQSPEGMSAIRDLIAFRTNDCRVAYQESLRPVKSRNLSSRWPVLSCNQKMER